MKTIQLTDEQYEALQNGESITIEPPKKKWEPEGGSVIIYPLGVIRQFERCPKQNNFGMAYPTIKLASRARDLMWPIHRYIAYATEHWPGHEVPRIGADAWLIGYNANLNTWEAVCHNYTRDPWIPYGPKDKVYKLVDKLNSGEVEF